MQYYEGLGNLPNLEGCVVTAGTFDGVHLGHRQILEKVREMAAQRGVPSVVITYWPHPRLVLFPDQTDLKLLSTLEEKRQLLAVAGIDVSLVLPFTKEFSQWSYRQYLENVLARGVRAGVFVIGHDHQFGRDREGGFEKLQAEAPALGIQVEEIPAQVVQQAAVSSSRIRKALVSGDVEQAAQYLGRPYAFSGTVVKGMQLGRTLGYPTLNLAINDPLKLLPGGGVYAVRAEIEGALYGGMMNIGNNPTIEGKGWSVEVHVFGFSQEVYGRQATIHTLARLRDEEKFSSLDELTAQMREDERQALAVVK